MIPIYFAQAGGVPTPGRATGVGRLANDAQRPWQQPQRFDDADASHLHAA
jgi:hypothetical protein